MHLNIGPAFGKSLRSSRRSARLSQEALALAAKLDRSYISLLERGQRKPSLECVLVLAKALNVNPVKFVNDVVKDLEDLSHQAASEDNFAPRGSDRRMRYFVPKY